MILDGPLRDEERLRDLPVWKRLTGAAGARGVFTAPATDIMGNRTDTFKFSNGSFRVRHSPGHGPQSFNPRTCLVKVSQHGTYRLSHGTGKYAGIKGHGRYHVTVLAIGARNANGKCSQRKAPVAFQQIIKASGPKFTGSQDAGPAGHR